MFTNGCKLAAVALVVFSANLTWARVLKLGDGKVSSDPKVGYLFTCRRGNWRGGPAHAGPWIHGSTWDPSQKPEVEGQVHWPEHQFKIQIHGNFRWIIGNGLPDHPTGIFPIQKTDPVYKFDHNPNEIRPQRISLKLPLHPRLAQEPSCVPMGMIGISLDGVAIYNAVDAGGRDAVAHEVQDKCHGHPDQRGMYHYHGPSPCMTNEKTSALVGYALDGFGIYGMKDRETGKILTDRDLDVCHGIKSPVLWNGKLTNIYHYVLTSDYPYTIGCFRGQPLRLRHRRPRPRMGFGGRFLPGRPRRRPRGVAF